MLEGAVSVFLYTALPRSYNTPRMEKLKVPKFASKADEAQWWYDHRDELTKAFEDAAAHGELRTGTAAKLARERTASTTPTTIRLEKGRP